MRNGGVCPRLVDRQLTLRYSVLETIADNYPKYVLSMDEVDFSRNVIIHEPIYQFLLDGR